MKNVAIVLVLALGAISQSCRSGGTQGSANADAGVGIDAGAATDAGLDAGADAGVDGGADAGVDADAGTDAGAATDAGLDAGADAGVDAGGAVDAGLDAGMAEDAGADAAVDAGVDAGTAAPDVRRWRDAGLIEVNNAGPASDPQIAVDPAGNAVAVWVQFDGTQYSIFANRYVADSGVWGVAGLIETDNVGGASAPQVAVDNAGNAIAVWSQSDGSRLNVWSNRYVADSGVWGDAGLIEADDAGNDRYPQVAVDTAGNAIAVWEQQIDTHNNIVANRYVAATGRWGDAGVIEADNTGNVELPKIAVDPAGNAVAVWTLLEYPRRNVWSNRYVAASGRWGDAGRIESIDAGSAADPHVAVDPAGNAVAVWRKWSGTGESVWANRYVAASGRWGDAGLIEMDKAGGPYEPQVAIDTAGNAVVVWYRWDGNRFDIWANRYVAASGLWGDAGLIESDNAGNAAYPQVAVDSAGNAVAVWWQSDGTRYSTWANRFLAATGLWGDAGLIETDNAGHAVSPQVAVDPAGNAVAVWPQSDGTRDNIWANVFR